MEKYEINNVIPQKKRYDSLDLLKMIAIIMVIILHCIHFEMNFIQENSFKSYINFFIRILCEGVPIFIVVNGFLIINKEFELKKHLKKLLNIFLIMSVWAFIDVILINYLNDSNLTLKEVIKNSVMIDISNKYNGPLWFLQNLIMLYLIFPILKVVHDNDKKIYNYFFIIIAIFTVGVKFLNNLLPCVDNIFKLNITKYFNVMLKHYNIINNGTFIFYFMLGGYIFEYKDTIEKYKRKFILLGILSSLISFRICCINIKAIK